ncbi:urea transporter [Pandoraea anhela]|uniref:Urea transporter n=1 Tax=Pandoraea anhela TaxID=2508295 RepID=A0A5E4U1U3_9BURK|nr:urea transporter [Pandoraea anhela]VVD93452.1 Urea transporter [Pandoraea anhela]
MSVPRSSSVSTPPTPVASPSPVGKQRWLIAELRATMSNFAQIYFMPSAGLGALLLAVLALADLPAAVTGWAASAAASGFAIALRLPRDQRRAGLLGYNSALTGIAFGALWQPDATFAAWLTVCSGMTVVVTAMLARHRLPALTGPFVAAMTLSWAAQPWLALTPRIGALSCDAATPGFVFCAVGQVVFIAPLVLGLLTWYLLALWDLRATLWALAAAVAVWMIFTAMSKHWPPMAIQAGGVGVNAFLAALGLGVFGHPPKHRLTGAMLAAAICVMLGTWLAPLGWPYFTLPFNLAVWLVLSVAAIRKRARNA